MRYNKNLAKLTASLLASVMAPGLALAQTQLDTIVVTAERKESTLQQTPIAITAIGGDQLKDAAIFDTEAIAASIPGLVVQRDVVGKVVIRGVGTENFTVGGDPGVAIYTDGSYNARSNAAIFDFFDVQRVEVLRGPQGTLYGRNAVGGVINIISNAPTEEFEANLSATYGNFEALRFEGAVSGPITDNIRVRLAGLYSEREGFTNNVFPDASERGFDELDNRDLFALRGRVDIDLASNVKLELVGDIYRDDSNPPPFFYPEGPLLTTPNTVIPNDIRLVSQGFESDVFGISDIPGVTGQRQDQSSGTAKLTWDTDFATIQLTSSYRETGFEWINDGDGFTDFFVVYFQRDESDSFTQDFQLTSNNDGPFEWIVGGTYFTESSDGVYAIPLGPAFGASTIVFQGTNETDAFGIFAEGKYTFGDFAFTAGIRYSNETKDATLNFGQSA
ncbi:MAG: TonB-dependent receptor plug domain-containing protein, partial [Pseudomonadota bacterium]